jgi:hypothetical protein
MNPELAVVSAVVLGLLFAYFFPTTVAYMRGHQSQGGIMILNLVFGWTLLGWVVALIWACSAVEAPRRYR